MQLASALANMAHSFNSFVFLYKSLTQNSELGLTSFDESFSSRHYLNGKHKLISLANNFGLQILNKSYTL